MPEENETLSTSRKLFQLVQEDLQTISKWKEKTEGFSELRIGARKGRTLPYPGAPNFTVPIIDDNINTVVAQKMRALFQPKTLASFLPLSADAHQLRQDVELAFHSLFRMIPNFRSHVENIMHNLEEKGCGFAVFTLDSTAYKKFMRSEEDHDIPVFISEHPYNIILPPDAQFVEDLDRYTRVLKLSEEKFKSLAKANSWPQEEVKKILKMKQRTVDSGGGQTSSDFSVYGYQAKIGGDVREDSESFIYLHEGCYTKDGERRINIYSVELPDIELSDEPWEWPDSPDEVRPWPLIAFVRERRNLEVHDSRGGAELLRDNQLAASQFKNLRGMMFDYTGIPMFKGGTTFSTGKTKIRPGGVIPEGVEFAQLGEVSPQFDFSIDQERRDAALRIGGSGGSQSSTSAAKDPITATESNRVALNADMLIIDGVDRFAESFTSYLRMSWEYLQRNPIPLPILTDSKNFKGQLQPEQIANTPFMVMASASSRNSDPIFLLSQIVQLVPFLLQIPAVKQGQLAEYILSLINPLIADDIVVDTDQGSPLEQMVQQLAQQLEQLIPIVSENRQYITSEIEEEEGQKFETAG